MPRKIWKELTPIIMKVEDINPWDKNPKKHNDQAISKSIDRFGIRQAIIVQKGTNRIIVGHGRLKAFMEAGHKEVPVIEWECTDEEADAFAIADNQTTILGGWDEEMLTESLKDIQSKGMLEFTGFSDIDLSNLIDQYQPADIIEDTAPVPPKKAKSRPGDIYLLGKHRLMCGDSTKEGEVKLLMDGVKADMVFTDPPYNVNYVPEEAPCGREKQRKVNKLGGIKNDNIQDFGAFLDQIIDNLVVFTKREVVYYICTGFSWWHELRKAITNKIHFSSLIVWDKGSMLLTKKDYHTQYEFILYGWKESQSHYWCGDRTQTDVWGEKRDAPIKYVHPTQKPVSLSSRAILNSSKSKDIVLDLFGGSGSTLIACEQLNTQPTLKGMSKRTCYMMELDPIYIDVIIKRWENLTGKKAKRIRRKKA